LFRWCKDHEPVAEARYQTLDEAKLAAVKGLPVYKARRGADSAVVTDPDEILYLRVF
jgi:hypothetical protein